LEVVYVVEEEPRTEPYGIIGKSVRWIKNWLANRKQSVVIDGSTSDAVSVDSGVPQGSVLGSSSTT
jgi:hypothetical protein